MDAREWPPPGAELLLEAVVSGEHVPAGSKNGFALRRKDDDGIWRVEIRHDSEGNESAPVTVSDTNASKLTKRAKHIARELEPQLEGFTMPGHDVPLAIEVVFFVPRGLTHYGTGRNADQLKPSAPAYPATQPDATKLMRGFEDALTGVLWHDDSRIVRQLVWEDFVHRWEQPRTELRYFRLPQHVGVDGVREEQGALALNV